MTKIGLTKRIIEALNFEDLDTPPKGDRVYIGDKHTPGLTLCITRTNAKVFYLVKRVHGRPSRIRLGAAQELSVEQARKLAAKKLGEIADGHDPVQERRIRRRQATLQELFDNYAAIHAAAHCRESSRREDRRLFGQHLTPWANRRLDSITTADIAALHGKVGSKTPYLANRLLALLCKLFNHAKKTLKWTGDNPATGVRRFREQSRDRFLDANELRRFFEALGTESGYWQDFFLAALLTGARRSNVQSMAWADIDLARNVWTIPETLSKSREPMTVILPARGRDILQRRLQDANGNPHVFPSWGSTGHLSEVKSAWRRICKNASLTNCRMHDLRRTYGAWQTAAGASLPIIGRSLGHKSLAATQVYARLSLEPIRESVTKATDLMLLSEPKPEKKARSRKASTEGKCDA